MIMKKLNRFWKHWVSVLNPREYQTEKTPRGNKGKKVHRYCNIGNKINPKDNFDMDHHLFVWSGVAQKSTARAKISNIIDNKWRHAKIGGEYLMKKF